MREYLHGSRRESMNLQLHHVQGERKATASKPTHVDGPYPWKVEASDKSLRKHSPISR